MGRLFDYYTILNLSVLIGVSGMPRKAIAQPFPDNTTTIDRLQAAQTSYTSGRYRQAFQQWQALLTADPSQLPPSQRSSIQVNQGLALQELGQLQQACIQFMSVLALSPEHCQRQGATSNQSQLPLRNISLQSSQQFFSAVFGSPVLWHLGKPADASALMQWTVEQSSSFEQGHYRHLAQLGQADLQHLQCKQDLELSFLLDDIALQTQKLNETLAACQQVFKDYQALLAYDDIKGQAQVRWLELYTTLQRWNTQESKHPLVQQMVAQSYEEAINIWKQASLHAEQLGDEGRLELELQLIRQGLKLQPGKTGLFILDTFARLQRALTRSKAGDNLKEQAIAYQLLGDLYQNTQQWTQAESAYLSALNTTEQLEQWGVAAQIYHRLAQVYLQNEQPTQALEAYENAIQRLALGSPSTTNLNFSFQEQITAIHHDYMTLLLQQANPDYGKVIALNEQLRVKELINYLRCDPLILESLATRPKTSTPTHFIHILQLDHSFHVIAQLASGDYHYHQPNRQTVETNLNRLLFNLKSDTFAISSERPIQLAANSLYQEILGPIASQLKPDSTLVFSLDSGLQRLPMALLHDGQQYLFEKHALSTNFGLQVVTSPGVSTPLKNVLIAGLSKASPSLQSLTREQRPPLINVQQETQAIADVATQSEVLLNQTFTMAQLQQRLYRQDYPIVHIATHGSFSSDPEETYLLAWDQKIRLPDFERLLQTLNQQGQALELLVLSACETAQGDRRATLGLAGLATQTGAQTTVASLWKVDDQATAQLMTAFYTALATGKPKAEALRQAQLNLRNSEAYRSPYYWAPFILLGHWQ